LVNISNKHLIKHTVLLIYGGLWCAPERRGDKLVVRGGCELRCPEEKGRK
jgi:hypothetical protein